MPELDGLSVIRAMAEEGLGDVPVLVLTAMDLNDEGQAGIMQDLVVTSRLGLGSADLVRYVEAIAQAARPRYVGSVASWGIAQGGQAMPVAAS
jgi:CheY-like chemotaxis protein